MRKKLFLILFAPLAVFAFASCSSHGGIFQSGCQCPKFGQHNPQKHVNESHAAINTVQEIN